MYLEKIDFRNNRQPEEKTTPTLTEKLEQQAHLLYCRDKMLPYHNWLHASDVRTNSRAFVSQFQHNGLAIDKKAVDHAALFHDILYTLEPKIFGFTSKEGLAAHYTACLLRNHGASESHTEAVKQAILGTDFNVKPRSLEAMAVRAADLQGTAAPYVEFLEESKNLWNEHLLTNSPPLSFADYTKKRMRLLSQYMWLFFQITKASLNEKGLSVWHTNTLDNIKTFLLENAFLNRIQDTLDTPTLTQLEETLRNTPVDNLLVIQHTDENWREAAMKILTETLPDPRTAPFIFIVPPVEKTYKLK